MWLCLWIHCVALVSARTRSNPNVPALETQSPRRLVAPCLRGGRLATRPSRTTACETAWTWTLQPASEFYRRTVDEWQKTNTIDESPASANSRSGRKGTPEPAPASRRNEPARTCVLRTCAFLQTPLLPSGSATNNEACEVCVFKVLQPLARMLNLPERHRSPRLRLRTPAMRFPQRC